jgi:hypothetical protein
MSVGVVCKEPGGEYLHHFTPGESTKELLAAKAVAHEIQKTFIVIIFFLLN